MSASSLSNRNEGSLSKIEPRWWLLFAIVTVGVCSRLLPHEHNFSPILPLALFAGASFAGWRSAIGVTLVTMFVSDLFLGLHWTMPIVYASICINILIGRLFVTSRQPWTVPFGALLGSVQFFVITNAACLTDFSAAGVAQCYTSALPFFRTSLAADLLFSVVLFGSFAVVQNLVPALRDRRAVSN